MKKRGILNTLASSLTPLLTIFYHFTVLSGDPLRECLKNHPDKEQSYCTALQK